MQKDLQHLQNMGASKVALMAVPAYHGLTLMSDHVEYGQALKVRQQNGQEIFLHGYRHLMPEKLKGAINLQGDHVIEEKWQRSLAGKIFNRFNADEAEFAGLNPSQQNQLLTLGQKQFQDMGLSLQGFVVPTWQGCPALSLLKEKKFHFTESRTCIWDLQRNERKIIPALAWMGNKSFNEILHLLLTAHRQSPWHLFSTLRIALHPGDFSKAGMEKALGALLQCGVCISYTDLFQKES